jgi:hypothetical protein
MSRLNRSRFLILLMLFAFAGSHAQDFNNYHPLKSSGHLPRAFVALTADKVRADVEAARKRGEFENHSNSEFYTESHYVVDRLLQSGKILTGDPLTKYVNRVADTLLKDDPKLRGQLQFFIVKSPYVNAFTVFDGYIFINIGLLAQLENEAQLAYILSHEIIHYRNKHSIKTFLEYLKIDRNSGGSYRDQIEDKLEYSKEQEHEADEEGFDLYKKSGYDIGAVMSAFDVMQYSYLPFDEVAFEKTFFEDENLKLPDDYFLKETKSISNDDNFDDSKSTHPNVRKRKQALLPRIEGAGSDGGKRKYIVSESEFKRIQTISRFEMCRLYLLGREYPDAIYASYLLQKKYPNSVYLKKTTGKALYNVAAYWSYIRDKSDAAYIFRRSQLGSDGDGRWSTPDFDEVEGSSQQVFHLLRKLDSDQAAVVALNYNWKLHKEYPKDREVERICDSLFYILAYKHELTLDNFSRKTRAEMIHEKAVKDSLAKLDVKKDTVAESKYDKIRKQQEDKAISGNDEKFIYYAFAAFMKDEEFRTKFNEMESAARRRREKEKDDDERMNRSYSNNQGFKGLGIEKIVVVEPFALEIDNRKRDSKTLYLPSEKSQEELVRMLPEVAKMRGVSATVVDPQHLDTADINAYNNMSDVKEWITERMRQGDLLMPMVLGADSASALTEKFGTRYFMWSGVVNIRERKRLLYPILAVGGGGMLLNAGITNNNTRLTAFGGVIMALGGFAIVRSPYHNLYYTMVCDVETGKVVYSMYEENRGRATAAKTKTKLGKVFTDLKKKP